MYVRGQDSRDGLYIYFVREIKISFKSRSALSYHEYFHATVTFLLTLL